ncbi:acyl carrier protein [Streptomyces sp. CA-250714]|uniref:acyl carrier protein n=1 Tax=Streptomyces sp. CA-250714 TaxID=3240060 RepID=UPI003D8D7247
MSLCPTELENRLRALLSEQLAVAPEEISPERTFRELEVDSLALLELLVTVENDLGLERPADLRDIDQDATLAEAARTLERAVREAAEPATEVSLSSTPSRPEGRHAPH